MSHRETYQSNNAFSIPTLMRVLWRYRFLAAMLVWKAIRAKYSRTLLGPTWVIIQPLGATLCVTLFFQGLFSHGKHPYWMQIATAMTMWPIFTGIVDRAGNCLVQQEDLITKVYFPRILLPLCASLAYLVDLTLVVALTVCFIWPYSHSWLLLLLPCFYVPGYLLATSLGLLFSSTMIFIRDVRLILPFILQIALYLTPILFPFASLSPQLQSIISWNPLTPVILGIQACFGLGPFPTMECYVYALGISLLLFIGSIFYFSRLERTFADQL